MVSMSRPAPVDAQGAVSALYQQHWVGLVRLAVLMVDDRQAAEDVVQEAFAELYRRWPLRGADAALAYLRTAVLNRSRSVLRRRKVARLYVPPHQTPNASAESDAVLGEERSQVQQALQALPRGPERSSCSGTTSISRSRRSPSFSGSASRPPAPRRRAVSPS